MPSAPSHQPFPTTARPMIAALRPSLIREVANAGIGLEGVLPFWFGEPDETTPIAVREVASRELAAGNTFYTQTAGTPELRDSIATYAARLHGKVTPDQIAVTASGTTALMITVQTLIGPGDRVVAVSPLWPNLLEMPKVIGAQLDTVSLDFSAAGWTLDVDKLLTALTPGTRALLLNSPNNPTGWTITSEDQRAILDHCRRHGIWIIADDVYERIYFDGDRAPSFLDIAADDDLVVSCNSFSKTWLMTGWRIGWITSPAALTPQLAKMIEFSTSCSPGFVQAAAQYAIEHGEEQIARTVTRLRDARDRLDEQLAPLPGVHVAAPARGAMYSFFRVDGVTDSLAFCRSLIAEVGLGLAPGAAFGDEGEGYLRWCFASDLARIDEGVERLHTYLTGRA